jgi:chromosome segregation ATPase
MVTKWIKEAIKAHTDEAGAVNIEELTQAINAEYPKYAVPKEQYNAQALKLKTASETIAQLENQHKDIASLQSEIENYKAKALQVEAELVATKNKATLKEQLAKAGATDVDYMAYKLGELETNEDGTYKDLDNKVKELKENNPNWFKDVSNPPDNPTPATNPNATGYTPLDGKLPQGSTHNAAELVANEFKQAIGL